MSECFVGSVVLWAGSFVPQGWNLCDGTELPINGNELLFAVIGTTYGGNGQTNFALPNLLNKVPMGTSPTVALASKGGSTTATTKTEVTLIADNLPVHDHTNSTLVLTAVTADTTVKLSTDTTGGQQIAGQSSMLTGTTAGSAAAAAIYLPSTTTPLAPVHLGGVTTTIAADVNVTVSDNVTGNAATAPAPVAFTGQLTDTTLLGQTLNYIICTSGLYPTRN